MAFETLILLLVIVAVIAVYLFFRITGHLIVNTILGLIILFVGNSIFSLGIPYTIPVVLICAFGGIPGAILVILLHALNIAFV